MRLERQAGGGMWKNLNDSQRVIPLSNGQWESFPARAVTVSDLHFKQLILAAT